MAANANNGPNNINFIRPYRPNPGRCRHFDHFWIPYIQINSGATVAENGSFPCNIAPIPELLRVFRTVGPPEVMVY